MNEKIILLENIVKKIYSCYNWDEPENNEFYKWVELKKKEGVHPSLLSYPNYVYELVEPYVKFYLPPDK